MVCWLRSSLYLGEVLVLVLAKPEPSPCLVLTVNMTESSAVVASLTSLVLTALVLTVIGLLLRGAFVFED